MNNNENKEMIVDNSEQHSYWVRNPSGVVNVRVNEVTDALVQAFFDTSKNTFDMLSIVESSVGGLYTWKSIQSPQDVEDAVAVFAVNGIVVVSIYLSSKDFAIYTNPSK